MKYAIDQICNIKMMALDATMTISGEGSIDVVKNTHDVGIGIIRSYFEDDEEDSLLYQIAVIEGRFDGHRNDLGELWVNEFELSEVTND